MIRFPHTILGTVCIPWREDYSFDETRFRAQTRFLVEHGLRDLYIFGTAGEGYAVTDSQFDAVTQAFADEMKTLDARPMVGVISLSLNTIIERIERAAAMGVNAFQLSLPAWGALTAKEVRTFFRETCDRFPELQFLHYNLMRSGRLITPAEYAILAMEHENLVATKNSTRDTMLLQALLEKAPQLRLFCTEPGFAYGSLLGECGLLISVASMHPERARFYFNAAADGNITALLAMQKELVEMTNDLIELVGAQAHMDGAYDKIFSKLHDAEFPLRLLPPYHSVSEETFARYAARLRDCYPNWLPSRHYDDRESVLPLTSAPIRQLVTCENS